MALPELPNTGTVNFELECPTTLEVWRDVIPNTSSVTHIHTSGNSIYIMFDFARSRFFNGSVDGMLAVDKISSNLYLWNSGTSRYNVVSGDPIMAEVFD